MSNFLDAIKAYEDGLPLKEIFRRYQISQTSLYRHLNRAGVQRHRRDSYAYPFDVRCWEVIDSEEKAYWLGFFSADGCVVNSNRITLALHDKDRIHLEKYAQFLKFLGPICSYRNNFGSPYSRISVSSAMTVLDLGKLGVEPRKSKTLSPWFSQDQKLMGHYWRGIFDGDGHIYEYKSKGSVCWRVGLSGNRQICESFVKFITASCGQTANLLPDRSIFSVRWGGSLAPFQVADVLYKDAQIFLTRKMEAYLKLKEKVER